MKTTKQIIKALIPSYLHLSLMCPRFIRKRVVERTGCRIAGGPFEGMVYITVSCGSVLEPKLIGIYEKEIRGFVEQLILMKPETIIDIGSAEGYYAVGLALRLPKSKVIAFEADNEGRRLLKNLAEKNEVLERIQIFGTCDIKNLGKALENSQNNAVVCDVEGAESELLDPVKVPSLKFSAVLVELHQRTSPGVKNLIMNRFKNTHEIFSETQVPRTLADFPYREFPIPLFPEAYIQTAVSELRHCEGLMEWLWMVPKRNPPA